MKRFFVVPIIFALIFSVVTIQSGCVGLIGKGNPEVKLLSMSKATAEGLALAAIDANKQGYLSDENLSKVKYAYEKTRGYNDTLIDAFVRSVDYGIDPQSNDDYKTAMYNYSLALREFLDLAKQFGLLKGETK